tara:strand:- start:1203 stop:2105 length:903 start_codon:yes stop_codon:yes gene_type:complete
LKNSPLIKGIFFTSLASTFWGIPQPLIFNEIKFIPALEIASHRGVWSFIFLFVAIFFLGKIKDFLILFKSLKIIVILSIASILIATNWIGFVLAVSINRVQDASMGYFLTPMISIGLGYLFLNEKISFLKLISILLMIFAIIFLIISLRTFPYLAILIGTSWGIYGLLKKKINISSEIGLLYESGFICLIAIPYLIYLNFMDNAFFLNSDSTTSVFLILTGAVTVFPLFFFNVGVKFIPLGFAGVIFYMAPTFHFITSVFILKENLSIPKLITFVIIWFAVLIFIVEVIKEEKIIENKTQ